MQQIDSASKGYWLFKTLLDKQKLQAHILHNMEYNVSLICIFSPFLFFIYLFIKYQQDRITAA